MEIMSVAISSTLFSPFLINWEQPVHFPIDSFHNCIASAEPYAVEHFGVKLWNLSLRWMEIVQLIVVAPAQRCYYFIPLALISILLTKTNPKRNVFVERDILQNFYVQNTLKNESTISR